MKILRKIKRLLARIYYKIKKTDPSYFVRNERLMDGSPAKQNAVNLSDSIFYDKNGYGNMGDVLSRIILEYMCELNNINPYKEVKKTKHLYCIGSIIDFGIQDATIWGSGLIHDSMNHPPYRRKLDVRCVRGPETRRILKENKFKCPKVYGDPSILCPDIYDPKCSKKYNYLIVPHYIHNLDNEFVINPLVKNWKDYVDKLCQAKLIISSSLHGIILAESYGIPAIRLTEPTGEIANFKFNDWYFSTGRKNYPVANSIDEALKLEPPELPNLEPLKNNLYKSFPVDLWK